MHVFNIYIPSEQGKIIICSCGNSQRINQLLTIPEDLSSSPVFSRVRVTRSLVLCVCFVDYCLSFCPFSFGHCVVCPSLIYGFWLPLWYLQTLQMINVICISICLSLCHIKGSVNIKKCSLSYYLNINFKTMDRHRLFYNKNRIKFHYCLLNIHN